MGQFPGSIPGVIVAVVSLLVIHQMSKESSLSGRKGGNMKPTNMMFIEIRWLKSMFREIGVGIICNWIAGGLPALAWTNGLNRDGFLGGESRACWIVLAIRRCQFTCDNIRIHSTIWFHEITAGAAHDHSWLTGIYRGRDDGPGATAITSSITLGPRSASPKRCRVRDVLPRRTVRRMTRTAASHDHYLTVPQLIERWPVGRTVVYLLIRTPDFPPALVLLRDCHGQPRSKG